MRACNAKCHLYLVPKPPPDPREQLRALHRILLERRERFSEFKYLVSCYPKATRADGSETTEAFLVREQLNECIADWLGEDFDGLSPEQVREFRAVLIEDRPQRCSS